MKAKEMFEELGFYLDIETNKEQIVYARNILDKNTLGYIDSEILVFDKEYANLCTTNKCIFNLYEIKAINKQMKELGWNNER